MKKIFLAAGVLFTTTTATLAQNMNDRDDATAMTMMPKDSRSATRRETRMKNETSVSDLTRNQFASDFPDAANVHFIATANFDEVSFTKGRKQFRAYYDYENQLVGTTQKKAFSDLPQNAQKEILAKYADYTVAGVIKFDDNQTNETDMIMYGSSFNNADNYFVELRKDIKAIVLQVDLEGDVSFFTTMK